MTDQQYEAHKWLLNKEDDDKIVTSEDELRELVERRSKLLDQGVGNYDAEKIRGGSDPNPSESKFIEFSYLSAQIEEKEKRIASKNIQKYQVIEKVSDPLLRAFLIGRYINGKIWEQVGRDHNYEKSQAHDIGLKALDAVYPYVKEAKYG